MIRDSVFSGLQFFSIPNRKALLLILAGICFIVFAGRMVGQGQWSLPLGLGVGMILVLVLLKSFKAGFLIFLFLMPLLPQAFGIRLSGVPILLTAQRLLIVPILGVWFLRVFQRRSWNPPPRWFFFFVLLHFGVRAASAFYAPDTLPALFRIGADSLEFMGLFLAVTDFCTEEGIDPIIKDWIAGSFVTLFFGLSEIVTGLSIVQQFALTPTLVFWRTDQLGYGFQRVFSLFDHPISYSWFSCIALLAALVLWLGSKRGVQGRLLLVAVLANLVSIVLSFGRGPAIGLVVALGTLALLGTTREPGKVLGGLVLILMLLLTFQNAVPVASESRLLALADTVNYDSTENPVAWSVQARVNLISNGLSLVASAPFGYGYTSTTRNRDSTFYSMTFADMYGFESAYIAILVETGFLGLVSFLLLLFWCIRRSLTTVTGTWSNRDIGWSTPLFLLLISIFYLVTLVGTPFLGNQEQVFWVVMGMAGGYFNYADINGEST